MPLKMGSCLIRSSFPQTGTQPPPGDSLATLSCTAVLRVQPRPLGIQVSGLDLPQQGSLEPARLGQGGHPSLSPLPAVTPAFQRAGCRRGLWVRGAQRSYAGGQCQLCQRKGGFGCTSLFTAAGPPSEPSPINSQGPDGLPVWGQFPPWGWGLPPPPRLTC